MPQGKGLVVDKELKKSVDTDNDNHHQPGVCLIFHFEENMIDYYCMYGR